MKTFRSSAPAYSDDIFFRPAKRQLLSRCLPRAQVRDADAVMVCLKRALKLANAAAQQLAVAPRATGLGGPVWLFVDILNAYASHYAAGNPNITPDVLQVRYMPVRLCLPSCPACHSKQLLL